MKNKIYFGFLLVLFLGLNLSCSNDNDGVEEVLLEETNQNDALLGVWYRSGPDGFEEFLTLEVNNANYFGNSTSKINGELNDVANFNWSTDGNIIKMETDYEAYYREFSIVGNELTLGTYTYIRI